MPRETAAIDTALATVELEEMFPRPLIADRLTARSYTPAEVAALCGSFPGLDAGLAATILRYRDPGAASIWLNTFLTEFEVGDVGSLHHAVLLTALPLYAMYDGACGLTKADFDPPA